MARQKKLDLIAGCPVDMLLAHLQSPVPVPCLTHDAETAYNLVHIS